MKSTIRLFRAIPLPEKGVVRRIPDEILKKTVERGFIFGHEIVYTHTDKELLDLIKIVEKEIGLTPKQMNSSFHKSWHKVRDASRFQLVVEQLVHYITTYGFEHFGIYSQDTVYFPDEDLKIPKLKGGIRLVFIKGYTKEQLKEKTLKFLSTGIALKEDTIRDVVDVALYVDMDEDDIETVKNKETKILLYTSLGKVPKHPIEFLRYIVYKSTGRTLLIKNTGTIEEIKKKDNLDVLHLFKQYEINHGLENLGRIFFRFKPLFLAFRTNSKLKRTINKIRRYANSYHDPMRPDYLNNITGLIKTGKGIDDFRLTQELNRVNIFRKIRLAYALNFRTKDVDAILYKIRNGKGYAKDFTFENKDEAKRVYNIVLNSIAESIKSNVDGKTVYIPDDVVYSLPATEKQFTGNFPSGSYVTVPSDMIVGVHWNNLKNGRIDLDLSLINANIGKIGWDSYYRSDDRRILFSGDITDAVGNNGASELFYVKKQSPMAMIMMLNYFNHGDKYGTVPFKFLVARDKMVSIRKNYTVNPNNIVLTTNSKIEETQMTLGILVVSKNENRFYFSEINLGKSITSKGGSFVEKSRKYLFDYYTNAVSLNDVLELAGAKIVTEKDEDTKVDIDLSPELLEKDTIIGLLT